MMAPRIGTALAILTIAASGSPSAQEVQPSGVTVEMYGYQTASCGSWILARQASSLDAVTYESWVAGYVTAFNVYSRAAVGHQVETDSAGLVVWVDTYCRAHPMDILINAVANLIRQRP